MKLPLNHRRLWSILGVGAAIAAFFLVARAFAADKQPAPKPPNSQPLAKAILDRPKSKIEMPTKRILAKQTNPTAVEDTGAFVNPKVEPGKVRWHKDFAAACRAAKKSGKPVLLFQMMGKLDDQFC